jgi:hypothetical protein
MVASVSTTTLVYLAACGMVDAYGLYATLQVGITLCVILVSSFILSRESALNILIGTVICFWFASSYGFGSNLGFVGTIGSLLAAVVLVILSILDVFLCFRTYDICYEMWTVSGEVLELSD